MTQEILKLALEYIEAVPDDRYNAEHIDRDALITAIEEALAQPEQEPVAVYGYCPECGAKGVMRERRLNGNDKCANGHTYPSSKSTPPQLEQEQEPVADDFFKMIADKNPKPFPLPRRTWVGLFDEEIEVLFQTAAGADEEVHIRFARAIESKLKEVNT